MAPAPGPAPCRRSRLPEFAYAYFDKSLAAASPVAGRAAAGSRRSAAGTSRASRGATGSGAAVSATVGIGWSDERRWSLYYGARSLSHEFAEAKLFVALLDERHGEDEVGPTVRGRSRPVDCISK